MSELLVIAAAGFGLAGLIVVPSDGPVAFVRDRLPQVRPLQCLLCATPYATAAVYGLQAVLGGVVRELLLTVLIAVGMTVASMVLAGFAQPNPTRAKRCKGCSRKGVEGSSTTAQ